MGSKATHKRKRGKYLCRRCVEPSNKLVNCPVCGAFVCVERCAKAGVGCPCNQCAEAESSDA